MKTFLISLIFTLPFSFLFAGGPVTGRGSANRQSGSVRTYAVLIVKRIKLIPDRLVTKGNRIILKQRQGVRRAVFHEYSFLKTHFNSRFPSGLSRPLYVKVRIYKKSVRIWTPEVIRDRQGRPMPMQMPSGGFRTITYYCKIL